MNLHKLRANKSQVIFWLAYLCLLAVLLPHTAWAFDSFEPISWLGKSSAWAGAFAFEVVIASLTHKLSMRIANAPKRKDWIGKALFSYANPYLVGLLLATGVSVMANFAHSVEFGTDLLVYERYSIPPVVYSVAFGAALPVASLLFAWVLAQENIFEFHDNNAEQRIAELTQKIQSILASNKRLETELKQARVDIENAENAAENARKQTLSIEQVLTAISIENKADRILALRSLPCEIQNIQIAKLADCSPGYVSTILKSSNGNENRT